VKELENLTAISIGLCKCGRQIYAGKDKVAVVHALPYCKAFVRLDPVEFLRYVRRSRGIPDSALTEN
jgi:hypothetical protein